MAYNIGVNRIKFELRELALYCDNSIAVEVVGNDWTELRGIVVGPVDTPYEGGTFFLEINVPDLYPFSPPHVRFITKVWHPNISSTNGTFCLDNLKHQWSAALTLRTILLFLQGLLSVPNPEEPHDTVVADQALVNPAIFRQTARHWTNVYADGPIGICNLDEKVRTFVELMGVEENTSRIALSSNYWDEMKATTHIVKR